MRLAAAVAGLLVLLSGGLWAPAALAHATLVSSDPADGAVLATAPAQFMLTFNEPVSALSLRLVGAAHSVLLPNPPGRAASLVIPAPGLARGTHVLSWRVVSLDGHPVGGTVVFSIGEPSAQAPSAAIYTDRTVVAALWLVKLVLYLGLFIGIGGSGFINWLDHDRCGARAARIALSAGLLATPLAVGLQGTDALDAPLAQLTDPAVWRAGFDTSFGLTAIAAGLALLTGLLALKVRPRAVARGLSLAGMLGAGLALAASGHAGAAEPQWLTRPLVFIHAVAVTFWVGALLPLRIALQRDDGVAVLTRFSRAIPWAVAPLIASGIILAVVQVGAPGLLLTTAYGRVLCAKLTLVAALLALAAWNRFRLTPALAAGDGAARTALCRAIRLEVAVVVAVLALVAIWRFTPPPRALAIAASRPALLHIHTAQAMAEVRLEPARAGIARASIVIMTGDFGALDAKEVQLTLENKPAGIEAISRPAAKGADAVWRVEQFPMPQDGRWDVQVDILVNDFEKITLDGQIDLPTH